ncbi:MAG: mobile mystery protein [Tardiphaga sp.]|jgi:predicted DNA-binding mobile mystery protein A|nr:mobile mystery protein [Tardiphaga sp.]
MKASIRSRARKVLDDRLAPGEQVRTEIRYKPPAKGWIRAIRDALGMSSEQLARRVSLRSQSIDDWEKAEANGSIQLKTLRRAADALDCTLVYALVPKTSLENAVHSRARRIAMRDLGRVAHTMKLEDQATDDSDLEEQISEYVRDNIKDRDIWNEP